MNQTQLSSCLIWLLLLNCLTTTKAIEMRKELKGVPICICTQLIILSQMLMKTTGETSG